MTDEVFKAKLDEARTQINELPEGQRERLLVILAETQHRHEEMKQNFGRIHEALGEWQLMIKYLIFDREATRRELEELRRRVDGQNP